MLTIDDLRPAPLFADVADHLLQWIVDHSSELALHKGEALFTEGEPAERFFVLLHGTLQVTKKVGDRSVVLITHHAGAFTGEIPLLAGTPYIASGHAVEESRLLQLQSDDFFQMLGICTLTLRRLFATMSGRMQMTEAVVQQSEKLSGLGKMAAGLAHELNNPAAASSRAAKQLREKLQRVNASAQVLTGNLTAKQWGLLTALAATKPEIPLNEDALAQSEREDALLSWLDDHAIAESWEIASALADVGIKPEQLDPLAQAIGDGELEGAMHWLEATLAVNDLLQTVEQSTSRISELVKAIKAYSYMDQAQVQEINIQDGIETTLTILQYKLKKGDIQVIRAYGQDIPRICAYGSALNQVWTNLLDNAIDALQEQSAGQINIRTWQEGTFVCVDIADNGPGIPREIQSRIFEPFFTTKGVGKGTGMGLDTAYHIVVNDHHGTIEVHSLPGSTRFRICLPIDFVS